MTEAVRPTLLSAARAFVRGSTRAAALAIVPLATVQLVNTAHAQLVFPAAGILVSQSGSASPSHSGPSGFFDASLSSGAGRLFGANVSFTNANASGGSVNGFVEFDGSGGSGTLPISLPIAYDFTLGTSTGGISSLTWHLDFTTGALPGTQQIASGSGLGHFADLVFYAVGTGITLDYYGLDLIVDYQSASGTNTLDIVMNPPSQGFALNATAIPEPSTYAGLLGLAAGVLALFRRSVRRILS